MPVEFYRHNIEEEDFEVLKGVLRSLFLTTGPVVQRFEEAFSHWIEVPNVVAVNSCTGALHLSLHALGIGPGDEVITTPLTFVATALAIEHAGAVPVFVDVEPESGLMDPEQVIAAITAKTKAILPVHLYGTMADMLQFRRIADDHGLQLIEDAAHCIEGMRDGVRPGQLSDAACYSFYATKNLSCGEGGAIACRDDALAERLKRLRLHGMSKDAATRYSGGFSHWDVEERGWKYNMDSIHGALLIRQLQRLWGYWEARKSLALRYQTELGMEMPKTYGRPAYHLQTIWVDNRDKALKELQDAGIGVAVNYRAVHTLELYRKRYPKSAFPNATRIGERTVTLPLYPKLTEKEQDCVLSAAQNLADGILHLRV